MKKLKDPCPGGKISKSAETNDIFHSSDATTNISTTLKMLSHKVVQKSPPYTKPKKFSIRQRKW